MSDHNRRDNNFKAAAWVKFAAAALTRTNIPLEAATVADAMMLRFNDRFERTIDKTYVVKSRKKEIDK